MLHVEVLILTSFSANEEPSQSSLWRPENSDLFRWQLRRCLLYDRLQTIAILGSYIFINLILEDEIES